MYFVINQCVFCKSVSLVQKSKKSNKTLNRASVRYVPKLSVQGIQFRVVSVSLRVFSGYKTMMYTLEVGSVIFTNVRRQIGHDSHFIFYSIVHVYTLSSIVKDEEYRVVEIRILKRVKKYQPKLIINIISQRYKSCGETHTTYTETCNVCTNPNLLWVISS